MYVCILSILGAYEAVVITYHVIRKFGDSAQQLLPNNYFVIVYRVCKVASVKDTIM